MHTPFRGMRVAAVVEDWRPVLTLRSNRMWRHLR